MDAHWLGGALLAATEEAGEAGEPGVGLVGLLFWFAIVIVVLLGLMAHAKGDFANRVFKNPISQAFEQLYLFAENLTVGIIGGYGRKYIPMVFTFWAVIFVSNVLSLFSPFSPTMDLSFNMGMALIVIGYVQWEGIRQNGLFGHLGHFAGPKLGPALILINGMLFCIELVSELMKNVSLSLRLYGNIDGGHRATDAVNALTLDAGIPFMLGPFLIPIKLLTCVVQALIFSLLFCVYLSLVTHEPHHDHEPASGTAPAHAH